MARLDDIERRLLNWARWASGERVATVHLGYARTNVIAQLAGVRSGYREAVVPTVACEAAETDEALATLPGALRYTVAVHYLHAGGVAAQCAVLACSERALHQRIEAAHRAIAGWLAERAERRAAERLRVERLQESVRAR